MMRASLLSALVAVVDAHGRLTVPASRDALANSAIHLQNQPIAGGATANAFACRQSTGAAPALTVASGGTVDMTWSFSAAHVGDCAAYLSYDAANAAAETATWFKIANLRTCEVQNNQIVKVTIPSGLPASTHAVLRWEWYALHQAPGTIEFYSQCADIEITSAVAAGGALPTPRCPAPGWLPSTSGASQDNYRYAFGGGGAQFITGPKIATFETTPTACATPSTYKCPFDDATCDCGASSASKSTCPGYTPPAGGTAPPSMPPTTIASCSAFPNTDCQTHTVASGDTLSAIVGASKWASAPYTVATVAQVVAINGLADANVLDIGDLLVIPQPGCCDSSEAQPISVFVPEGSSSASSSASADADAEAKAKEAGAAAAIVILSLLLAFVTVVAGGAIVAAVYLLVLYKGANSSAAPPASQAGPPQLPPQKPGKTLREV